MPRKLGTKRPDVVIRNKSLKQRELVSKFFKGRKKIPLTEETKKKLSESLNQWHRKHKVTWGTKISMAKMGHSVSEETRKKFSEVRNRQVREGKFVGENHPNWKGGYPDCLGCGGKVSTRKTKRCITCSIKLSIGENAKNWRGGGNRDILRRVLKTEGGGFHSDQEWLSLKERYGFMCLCCKKTEPEIKLTEDHIIPISVWKSYIQFHPETDYLVNDIQNIQPLCLSCNSWKHTKIVKYSDTNISFYQVSP